MDYPNIIQRLFKDYPDYPKIMHRLSIDYLIIHRLSIDYPYIYGLNHHLNQSGHHLGPRNTAPGPPPRPASCSSSRPAAGPPPGHLATCMLVYMNMNTVYMN